MIEAVLFTFFSAVAIASALLMIRRGPMIYSVGMMILVLLSLAGLFLVLNAPFLALVQIIVYAGAVMVLFVFTAMIIGEQEDRSVEHGWFYGVFSLLVAGVLGVELTLIAGNVPVPRTLAGTFGCDVAGGNVVACVGELLFTDYILVLQVVALVILVAMIGAIYISRRPADRGAEAGEEGAT